MNRNLFRTCLITGALALFAACSDNPTAAPNPRLAPGDTPAYNETTPFNNEGACMADDAVRAPTGTISGVKFGDNPATVLNCTSQDVKIATADVISYAVAGADGNFPDPTLYVPGVPVSCDEGRQIQITMSARLNETATSARSDIGIWIATDGGTAQTGACNHYNLPTTLIDPASGVSNGDGDHCADLNAGAVVPHFELGTFTAVCEKAPGGGSDLLHIGSCLGWKEPGGDKVCQLVDDKPNTAPNWPSDGPDAFRFGTLFANKSKCNCDGFDVPITVVRPPSLHIAKTADAASVNSGSQIGFVVTVSNTGLGAANTVAVSDPLPIGSGVNWSIATPVTGWTITGTNPQTLSYSAATLAVGGSSAVHVISSTTSASCATYTNTATATALNQTTQPDPVSASTTVTCPTLSITKTPATQTVSAGTGFAWTVTLTNNGPGSVTGAAISDPLPSLTGVSYTVGAGSDASCSITSGTLNCGPKSLAANATIVAVINATTTAGTSCSASGITNTATGSATGVSNVQATATTIINCPSLSITKTPTTQAVSAGSPFSWTVTLRNTGAGTAVGSTISDPLPALTGVSYALGASDGTCSLNAAHTVLTCSSKDLVAGGTTVAVINATTTAGTSCSASGITNTATGSASGVSSVQAIATTTINCPSLSITKTPATQIVNSGSPFSWTVTLTNSGAGTAVGSTISDPLPALTGVSYALGASDGTCSLNAAHTVLTCSSKDLVAGGTTVAVINATTTAGTSCSASGITNTATGSASGVSSVQAIATTTINCPSLSITKTPATQIVNAGSPFSWTVTLTNSGAGTAVGSTISDPLPALTGVSYALGASDGTCSLNAAHTVLTCSSKDLVAGGTTVAVINATTTAGTSCSASGITNTATGSASGVSSVQAIATTTINCPSLSITKTPATQIVNSGSPFSWTVTLTNSGAGTAVNASISDPLPALTGVSYTLGGGSDATCSINAAGTTLTCGPKNLSQGGTIVANITATTTAGSSCSASGITNTATGSASGVSNVTASATTIINCPHLVITKTPTTQTVGGGSPFSWTVTLTNTGAGTAVGATISDPLPVVTGVSYTLGASSDATCAISAGGTLNCGPKNLAQNGTIVAIINATSTSLSCSATGFTNTATGSATGVSNVQASATTTINCPNLSIVKTPDVQGDAGYTVSPPGPALFTITVSNSAAAGTGVATNVVLTDTLPAGLTWAADNALCTSPIGTVVVTGVTRQELVCNIGTLPAGGIFTVHLSAPVPSSFVQQPPSPTGTAIEIEGDLIDGAPAGSDWASLSSTLFSCLTNPKRGCDLDKPTGATDDSFGQGTKEDSPVPTVVSGAIPNNKSDLQRFYVSTERFFTTDFLYLAWERVQAPSGTTNMDFELNRSSQLSANGVTPLRTAGDLLIKYDLSRGGTVPTLGYHVWLTSGNSNLCEASNAVPCWGKVTPLTTSVAAAVNTASVTDPILAPGQVGSRTLDALTFGEASINLQAAGIFQAGSCVSFGQAYLKSRSSDSFTSEVKDFIAPIPVSVTNCAPVTVNNLAWVKADNVSARSDAGQIRVTTP